MNRGSGFIYHVLLFKFYNDCRKEHESGELRNSLVNETEDCCRSFTSE